MPNFGLPLFILFNAAKLLLFCDILQQIGIFFLQKYIYLIVK